ncbi:MAG TPA: CBS domain-containing protein [Phycisphaerales bacterium]|jgi:CBS domain-containing protein|nr:CBS domain-containing protein [Phycisphaerales bacterium]
MKKELQAARLARDIMSGEPVCVDLGMSVREVWHLLEENEISGAPVVDGGGRLVGVVSRSDLIKKFSDGDMHLDGSTLIELFGNEEEDDGAMPERFVPVDDFMTPDPVTASPTTPLHDVAARMVAARVHRVIIVDKEQIPVGIVTSLDMVKTLADV